MELPPPWEIKESKNFPGRCFYYNKVTQESTWIRPIPYPGNRIPWPPAVFVLQILIKHSLLKNPVSPKGPVTRTQEEAKNLVKQIINDIVNESVPFEEEAKKYSDDESAENGGIIGWIKRSEKSQQIQESIWQLRIGEMSPPVNTDEGIYLFLRRG